MLRERGGSSSFARHAFNELIAFIAGWAILIDYLIVAALAAISVPALPGADLRRPRRAGLGDRHRGGGDRRRLRPQHPRRHRAGTASARSPSLALADIALQLAVIVVGVLAVFHPDRLTAQLDLFTNPELQGHRLRGRRRDARLRRDRGGLRPRARHRRRAARPEADRLARGVRGAAHLRRDGGDRADGGAGGRRAARARNRARQRVRRGAGARGRLRLRPGLGGRHDALDRRAGRRAGPVLGGDDLDARRLPPHLHAGDQPPDPELARQAEQPPRDPVRGDRDLRR